MSVVFGQFDKSGGGVALDPGMYEGIVESASLVLESDGRLKETEQGKNQVDVHVRVDRETALRRRMSISFGQNKSNGQWSVFSKFIEAATGVRCGEKAQRTVTEDDLRGKIVRMVVETNDRGYNDITSFLPAPKRPGQPAAPASHGFGAQVGAVEDDETPFFDEHGNPI